MSQNTNQDTLYHIAFIEEDLCIGCVKCIKACPVDAIMGAPKLMHTVIKQYCIGCNLCVPPCPMNCISMTPSYAKTGEIFDNANDVQKRFIMNQERKTNERFKTISKMESTSPTFPSNTINSDAKKTYINEAVSRVKKKREDLGR